MSNITDRKPNALNSTMNQLQLLTDKEVARLYGVHRATIWAWAKSGVIAQPIKTGGSTRWRLTDIQRDIQGSLQRATEPSASASGAHHAE